MLTYHLGQGKDEHRIAQQSIRERLDLRKTAPGLFDAPELRPWLELYWEAYGDLDSCRQSGLGAGPIPWTAIREYVDYKGLDADQEWRLTYFVRKMDTVLMEKSNGHKPGPGPVRKADGSGSKTLQRPSRKGR